MFHALGLSYQLLAKHVSPIGISLALQLEGTSSSCGGWGLGVGCHFHVFDVFWKPKRVPVWDTATLIVPLVCADPNTYMSKCFDLVEPDPIFFWDIQDFKSSMLLNDRSTSVTSPRYKCLIFISWLDRRSRLRKMRRSDVGKWDGQCLQSLPQCYVIFYTKSGPILIPFFMYTFFSCWKLQICLGGKLGNQHQCGFVDCACHPLIHNDNI